jgi:ESS family glutamate:Na+ symporter
MPITFSAWWLLPLVLPVLLLGEWLIARFRLLARFNIPVPVVGGLVVCVIMLLINLASRTPVNFATKVAAPWWTWVVAVEPEWLRDPARSLNLPFLVGFFTCLGLGATWRVVKAGSLQLLVFWGLSTALAVLQNLVGVGLANALGVSPLLGIMCGGVTLTGGHGTALGFAAEFQKAGLEAAAVIGVAAATFGVISGALVGGPVATRLIETRGLRSSDAPTGDPGGATGPDPEPTFLAQLRGLRSLGRRLLAAGLILAVCFKAGAWLGYALQKAGLLFPAYMGSMLVGVVFRNVHDALGLSWITSETIDRLGGVFLAVFLAMTMASLNLVDLAATAAPMLIILAAQVALMAAFAFWITFRMMGRDYDAAVMAAGQCGFGLGATSNAMATMLMIVQKHGPARRAFIIVPTTGALLIDVTNAFSITAFLNFFR